MKRAWKVHSVTAPGKLGRVDFWHCRSRKKWFIQIKDVGGQDGLALSAYSKEGVAEAIDLCLMTLERESFDCRHCKHCGISGDWEQPELEEYYCRRFPGFANLSSFPFRSTYCRAFEKRGEPARDQTREATRRRLEDAARSLIV